MKTGPIPTAANRLPIQRIYLTGFMGAGKSTVGALLATKLGWAYTDLDRHIEAQQGLPVSAIFEIAGESAFRLMELSALEEFHQRERCVISLGGGALEALEARTMLANDPAGLIVFLEAPLHLLLQRCMGQGGVATRPLLRVDEEQLQKRYEKRLTHYQKAHLTVATQDLTPEEVASLLHQQMAAFI